MSEPVDEPEFLKLSVLRLEFEIPSRWAKLLYALAGKARDPFPKMERTLKGSIDYEEGEEEEVRLIGFVIDEH